MPISTNLSDAIIAQTLNGLAHPRRVKIFDAIRFAPNGVLTYEALSNETKIPTTSLAHHLRVMKKSHIILTKIRGPYTEYRVKQEVLHLGFDALLARSAVRKAA